jgi:hypothetical protein
MTRKVFIAALTAPVLAALGLKATLHCADIRTAKVPNQLFTFNSNGGTPSFQGMMCVSWRAERCYGNHGQFTVPVDTTRIFISQGVSA